MKSYLSTAFLALLAGACASSSPAPIGPLPTPGATSPEITAADVRLRVSILAADSLAGRETGTAGGEAAARYLAAEVARLALRPAGDDGGYLQRVPMERSRTVVSFTLTTNGQARDLTLDEALPVTGLGGLPGSNRSSGSGSVLYAGHLIDPTVGADEVSVDQLNGAVVMVRLSVPDGLDPTTESPRMAVAAAFSPASPAAAILLVAEEAEEDFWEYAHEVATKGELALAGAPAPAVNGNPPPFFLISKTLAEQILGRDLAGARLPQTDLASFSYSVAEETQSVDAWNVAAIVPGSDPVRSNEYVGLGAHYDHVGIGVAVDGDTIYNGADDNASGTSALLEVAEALAFLPQSERPDRSTLFVWNTAEESGLLGSEYFTDRPTVNRNAITAHINLDMVGRNNLDSIMSVGSRRIASEFGEIVEEVNARQPSPFLFDYSYDVPGHPEQIYCRSDHYNYARYGIPIVFLTSGLHDDYHAPSDSADLLDYQKVAKVSSFVFDIVRELGDRPERLLVDQAVPPLGSPCS